MATTQDIVQKLWGFCDILRDDGVTYHQYVTELTYLLFLKMAKETRTEGALPEGFRWDNVVALTGAKQLSFYKSLLLHLGEKGTPRVRAIYANAQTAMREPANLAKLVAHIDALDWYSATAEGLGDLYEGLLQKNANEVKSGAGQYFTPRPLIDAMVACVKPRAGEVVQDPAAGTGGFLIAADRWVKAQTDDHFKLSEKQAEFQRTRAFRGVELVPDTRRLALMNLMLHRIDEGIELGDTLSSLGSDLCEKEPADVILTNPPFGTKTGGDAPRRADFTFVTSNKQLAFLQHVYRGLKPGGRAAVVLPDNVLFEDGVGVKIRGDLLEKCDLHTVLRLPTGIFYAAGVKTNVLFFTRGKGAGADKAQTKATWVYDLRTNMPSFGKRTPFTRAAFEEFERVYGADVYGKSERTETERWKCFTRDQVRARGDNLDISWLRDESSGQAAEVRDPGELVAEIKGELEAALGELRELEELLAGAGVGA